MRWWCVMPADPTRYVVMDDGRTILFGLHGPARSLPECREFLDQYRALLDAADPRVLHRAAVYRTVGFEMERVDAG